jgi:hypothetical protein
MVALPEVRDPRMVARRAVEARLPRTARRLGFDEGRPGSFLYHLVWSGVVTGQARGRERWDRRRQALQHVTADPTPVSGLAADCASKHVTMRLDLPNYRDPPSSLAGPGVVPFHVWLHPSRETRLSTTSLTIARPKCDSASTMQTWLCIGPERSRSSSKSQWKPPYPASETSIVILAETGY